MRSTDHASWVIAIVVLGALPAVAWWLASFDHHLTKGNNFTVVDMTGYPMEWRIAMAKRADASGRKDVIRIGF
jgi:hypothetical protein